jgi:cytochrome c biogenesis protein CcmG, thiol:disulfide interchange protein DsbE
MKKVVIVILLLLLPACSVSSTHVMGEVVSCESISKENSFTGGIDLKCLDGESGAQLEALRGPMVINVWGSWCGPCKEEIPIFRSFYEKAKGSVQLIGVNVEEASIEDGRDFVEHNGILWPNLYDPDGRSRKYFGMGVPVTWFIAADGSVTGKKIGVITDEEELIALTEKYLGVKL